VRSKLLDQENGRRAFALVFDIGDEVSAGLLAFAESQGLDGSHFTAIGALQDVVLGYWDWNSKTYQRIPPISWWGSRMVPRTAAISSRLTSGRLWR
jgi:hypothetical protein